MQILKLTRSVYHFFCFTFKDDGESHIFLCLFLCLSLTLSYWGQTGFARIRWPSPFSPGPQPQPLAFTVVIPARTTMPSRDFYVLENDRMPLNQKPRSQMSAMNEMRSTAFDVQVVYNEY